MPILINNMPSGAVQYPMVTGPNQAQINAANMFGFVNQQPNKEADMAAMLALVQLLSQQNNLNLQREFGRAELGLRKDEIDARRQENQLDRDLRRDEMTDARTQMDNNFKLLMKQAESQADSIKAQNDNLAEQLRQQGQITGSQLDSIKLQNAERARVEARDYINSAMQGRLSATESDIAAKQQQAEAEITRGALSGITAQQANESRPLTDVMGRVSQGKATDRDFKSLTDSLIPETQRVVKQAQSADPATAMAMLAKQRERINQYRSSVSDSENMLDANRWRSPQEILRDWWRGGNQLAEKRKQVLMSVADQADMWLSKAGGVPIPASSAPEAIAAQVRPQMLQDTAAQRSAAMRDLESKRASMLQAISTPGANFESILGSMIGGSGMNQMASPPVIRVPSTQPAAPMPGPTTMPASAPSEFDPFLQGLYMR